MSAAAAGREARVEEAERRIVGKVRVSVDPQGVVEDAFVSIRLVSLGGCGVAG